ncbi:1-acyl-sn-glycerol-3-phosphate acyltransferase [Acidithiobacillus sp. YTS05]|nr:1-acyl-sn-glycerol-3-phosphate acyltransferase [Acidithiobacillus sp. YTS05]
MTGLLVLARPHVSLLDGPRLAWWLAHRRGIRNALFPVDPAYARHPLCAPLLRGYGWLVGGHRMVPLDTDSPFALRHLAQILMAGKTIVLFPQGTGLKEGPDRPDRPGAQWLIERARPQVLTVTISQDRFILASRSLHHAQSLESRL